MLNNNFHERGKKSLIFIHFRGFNGWMTVKNKNSSLLLYFLALFTEIHMIQLNVQNNERDDERCKKKIIGL